MKPETMLFALMAMLGATHPAMQMPKGYVRHSSRRAIYPDNHGQRFFTIVGSRDKVPEDKLNQLYKYSVMLLAMGFTGRSGCAPGSDHQLTKAALKFNTATCELYLPWNDFEGFMDGHLLGNCLVTPAFDNYAEAKKIAETLHPAWNMLSNGARMLHTRNVYQVLGKDLNTPSELVLFAAPVDKYGSVKGGTATAVSLARRHGIPTFNMLKDEGLEEFETWFETWIENQGEWSKTHGRMLNESVQSDNTGSGNHDRHDSE